MRGPAQFTRSHPHLRARARPRAALRRSDSPGLRM
jgi:hypothetical protein